MKKINIELNKEQYKTLIEFLYIADYLADNGFVSKFKNSNEKNKLFELLEYLYSFGKKFGFPKSLSLATTTSEIPLTKDEVLALLKNTEATLYQVAQHIFAQKFAKRNLNLSKNEHLFDHEGGWMIKDKLILEHMQTYIQEFKENGIANLKFKLFKRPTGSKDA